MLRTRKRWISLLVTLAMVVAFCLPAGTAFAADPVIFSNAVKTGIQDNAFTNLGWIKIDIDNEVVPKTAEFYVTVTLPDGVKYEAEPDAAGVDITNYVYGINRSGAGVVPVIVGNPDKSKLTVKIADPAGVDYIEVLFNTDNQSYVFVEDGYSDDITVDVSVNAVDRGFELWSAPYTYKATVGKLGEAKITVSAGSPKKLTPGTGKSVATITISENQAGALGSLTNPEIYIELVDDDNFSITGATYNTGSDYGLGTGVVGTLSDNKKLTLSNFGTSSPFKDKLEVKLTVTVFPGATGDLEVAVSSNCDEIEEATLVLGTVGDTDVTVSTSGTPDTIYPAYSKTGNDNGFLIKKIKFEGNSNFGEGETIVLTLPEGFEWESQPNINPGGGDDEVDELGVFNGNRSLWYKLNSKFNDDELEISGLRINTAADAPVGDIEVEITGSLYEGSVVVGKCEARAGITAEKPNVKVGLDQAAGDITIVETKKDSLKNSDTIKLVLPSGIKFAADPKVEVNGSDKSWSKVGSCGKGYDFIELTIANLSDSKIDTVKITDIKYDLDSRVNYGDVEVEVIGSAFNKIDDTLKVNETDKDDAVATVANATVVSPTAAKATMKIGDPKIVINGVEKIMEAAPYIKNQRTYVSVTYAALACGVAPENIMWDGVNRTVTVIKGDRIAQFKIGSKVMTLNGAVVNMDTAPEIVNGRTMMPVTWVALALGGNTGWDAATQTVTVTVN